MVDGPDGLNWLGQHTRSTRGYQPAPSWTSRSRTADSGTSVATSEVLQRWADGTTDQATDPATALQHLRDHSPGAP